MKWDTTYCLILTAFQIRIHFILITIGVKFCMFTVEVTLSSEDLQMGLFIDLNVLFNWDFWHSEVACFTNLA